MWPNQKRMAAITSRSCKKLAKQIKQSTNAAEQQSINAAKPKTNGHNEGWHPEVVKKKTI